MLLVLTYHKVLPREAGDEDFYTITPELLSEQIQAAKRAGFRALVPADLLSPLPAGRAFLLTFDDGTRDHLDHVLPILEDHKCQATFFVPTAKLGRAAYLDAAMLSQLAAAGQVVGCHSHQHRRMDTMTHAELEDQFSTSLKILTELTGNRPSLFAPPGGYMNSRVQEAANRAGLKAIRTMRWGYNQPLDLNAIECVPVNRHFDQWKFELVLQGRSTPILYTAKETVKKIIPAKTYESIRRLFFRAAGRK